MCQVGYFYDGASCASCNAQATNCTESGVTVDSLPLLPDWWRLPNSTKLERCFSTSNCTGGSNASELCGLGYEGPFCGVCSKDVNGTKYHVSVGQCEPCEGSLIPAVVAIAVVVAVALLVFLVLKTARGRKLLNKARSKLSMAEKLTDKAKALLAKRGFDPVLGARPLRRTIQREIEDQLSEKILFEEVGPGQLVTVDVEGWDGEGAGEDAKFTFAGSRKPVGDAEPDLAQAGAAGAPSAAE